MNKSKRKCLFMCMRERALYISTMFWSTLMSDISHVLFQFDLNASIDAIYYSILSGHHWVTSNMTLTAQFTWFSGGHGPNKQLPQNGNANAFLLALALKHEWQSIINLFGSNSKHSAHLLCMSVRMWLCVYNSMGLCFYVLVSIQAIWVCECICKCVCVSSSCIIQMAWGYSLSCLQENSSWEKHADLSVSLCSSSQKQRVKSERDIHQLPAFFFLTAIPFDTFSFFLFIVLRNLPALSICNDSSRDFGTEWNKGNWIDNWKYKR